MVCASVREDNPRALASGLSPVQTHKRCNNVLIAPACICTLCEIFDVKMCNRCVYLVSMYALS